MARRRSAAAKKAPSNADLNTAIAKTILGAGWDGKDLAALRKELLADHKRRRRSATAFNAWDERLVCQYVFRGMTIGQTETALLLAIGLDYPTFWSMLKKQLLIQEFKIARRIQARAMADLSIDIARGLDEYSQRMHDRMTKILRNEFRRALRRMRKHKDAIRFARDVVEVKTGIKELERNLIARNRLMIEQNRWMAKTQDPARFGDKADLNLGGQNPDGTPTSTMKMLVEFVSATGKRMNPREGS